MKTLAEWLDEYALSHRNPVNQWIHKICVPVILVSIVGFFSLVRLPGLPASPFCSLAVPVALATLIFYLRLSLAAGAGMLLAEGLSLAFLAWLEPRLSWPLAWYGGAFVLAWIGQFLGHLVEGRKPSFFQDLQFLLIGPLWIGSSLLRRGSR